MNTKQLLFLATWAIFVVCAGCNKSSEPISKEANEALQNKSNSDPLTIKAYFDKIQVGMDRESVRQITGIAGSPKENNPEFEQTFFYDYDNSYITIVYKVESEKYTFSVLRKYHTIDNLTIKQRDKERFDALNEWLRQRR
ncbi:MAG: hypothetical protein JXA96_11200 [Sedimentisphaerales bacterium]|nr:hypothetical protein [Sedimentisphaerales bacterium]